MLRTPAEKKATGQMGVNTTPKKKASAAAAAAASSSSSSSSASVSASSKGGAWHPPIPQQLPKTGGEQQMLSNAPDTAFGLRRRNTFALNPTLPGVPAPILGAFNNMLKRVSETGPPPHTGTDGAGGVGGEGEE
jgi:hypothetical protein